MTISKLRALDWPDRRLLVRAAVLVVVCRVALWTAGVRRARAAARWAARRGGKCDVPRAPWAVQAVSRRMPAATCLVQALALQALLEHAGRDCRIEIGVARAGSFEAHAWVVCGTEIVLGGRAVSRYQTVGSLESH
jgi:hypothetical protein